MKAHPPIPEVSANASPSARARGGFAASVLVFFLLAVLAALLLSTTRMIRALDQELRLLERRQAEKYPVWPEAPVPQGR